MGLFRDKEDIKTIKDLEEHIEYLRTIIELKDFQIHNLRETLYFLKEKNNVIIKLAMRSSQVVRHQTLTLKFVGSNPTSSSIGYGKMK